MSTFVWGQSQIDFKGMLRRNIEHFPKNRIYEKLGISEMKFF